MVTMGYYYGSIANYMGYNYGNYNYGLLYSYPGIPMSWHVMACKGM